MKKLYNVLCVLFSFITTAQIVNIPDANFKAKLLAANSTTLTIAGYGIYPNFFLTTVDTNGDGEIQYSEAEALTYLNLTTSGIFDLTGIEHFTNLTHLFLGYNNLTNIDVLQLIYLEHLTCYQNQLTSLDISTLTNLKYVFFYNNQISTIDFSNNPQLEVAYCGNNQITNLDFSNNGLFHDLGCKNNPNLTTVNIQNGATQIFGPTTWLNECWTGLPNLTTICADTNEVVALQNYLTSCGIDISSINFHGNCALGNEEFGNDSIQIYPNPASSTVNINVNINIKTIELIDVQGRILVSKMVNENQVTLDVSDYAKGIYYVKVNTDKGSKIEKLVKK
jgi:Leucine-rich repeat (LRR) protein